MDELSHHKARLADYEAYTRISAGLALVQAPSTSNPTKRSHDTHARIAALMSHAAPARVFWPQQLTRDPRP